MFQSLGWASLVVGVLASVLICSASIAMLVKPASQPHTTHVHELRPVTIVPNATALEPMPVQVCRATPQSSIRQVRIQQNPSTLAHNGTERPRTSSGSSTNKSGSGVQNVKGSHHSHHNHHHHHHHGTVPRERSNVPDEHSSARSRRRRSYDEGNSRRSRPARGQVKQYV